MLTFILKHTEIYRDINYISFFQLNKENKVNGKSNV